jgi:hypothetical protein
MTKSEEVYQKITGYANYSQMNGISKSWIIECIDNALNEQLTLTDVGVTSYCDSKICNDSKGNLCNGWCKGVYKNEPKQ